MDDRAEAELKNAVAKYYYLLCTKLFLYVVNHKAGTWQQLFIVSLPLDSPYITMVTTSSDSA